MSVTPALKRLRHEDFCEFETSLGHVERDLVSTILHPLKKDETMLRASRWTSPPPEP